MAKKITTTTSIGDKTYTIQSPQKANLLNLKTDLLFAAEEVSGIATDPLLPAIGGSFFALNNAIAGNKIAIYSFGFAARVEQVTGAEFNATQYSRCILGLGYSLNTNNVYRQLAVDGACPQVSFDVEPFISEYVQAGLLFSLRTFTIQIPAPYVYVATDTVHVAAWLQFRVIA